VCIQDNNSPKYCVAYDDVGETIQVEFVPVRFDGVRGTAGMLCEDFAMN
jgi:hypothetical protein